MPRGAVKRSAREGGRKMSATLKYADVTVGDELPPVTYPVTRLSLAMYAGVSGDFTVIHCNEGIARSVGWPNVIAPGMFSLAEAGRYVTDWTGDPGAVEEF